MRCVLQRVRSARVSVGAEVAGEIGAGLLALLGVAMDDDLETAERLAAKTLALRIFASDERPFDRTLPEAGGALLVVSQFTLLGDLRRGNRPSWSRAARPEEAAPLVAAYADAAARSGVPVATGRFGAMMTVELVNDGPVTIILDSDELSAPRRARARPEPEP